MIILPRARSLIGITLIFALTSCTTLTSSDVTAAPSAPVTEAPLGTATNPIVLAIPAALPSDIAPLAQEMASQLSALTGLSIVTLEVSDERVLVTALSQGRVQIAWLSPLAYLYAHEKNYADIAFATTRGGQDKQAIQFMVNANAVARGEFKTYYDELSAANFTDTLHALAQFANKRPCWTDPYSATGYAAPLGVLADNGVPVKTGAFMQTEMDLVRSLYLDPAGGVCQFGATYFDARPLLAAEHEDVSLKVSIVWVSPPTVPFDAVVFGADLPQEARVPILSALTALTQSESGRAMLNSIYHTEAFEFADDSLFADLRHLVDVSGLLLFDLLK